MTDPFLTLHAPDGVPFRIRADDVRTIDAVLAEDGADGQARCCLNVIGAARYVRESSDEVYRLVVDHKQE